MPSVKAVATIGAPSEVSHVKHLFEDEIEVIREEGQSTVKYRRKSKNDRIPLFR
jgi:putative redox protein